MIDSFSILNRLGYNPTDKSDEQYRREPKLRPEGDPLSFIELPEEELITSLETENFSNIL